MIEDDYLLIVFLLFVSSILIFTTLIWKRRYSKKFAQHIELEENYKYLKASLESQVRAIDQFHGSVVTTDLDGIISGWSQGAENLFGYSSDDILGQHISLLYPEDKQEFLNQDLIPALHEQGSQQLEIKLLHKTGRAFYVHLILSMIYDENNRAVAMMGYSIDITDRKRETEALEKFKYTLDQTLDCVFMFDAVELQFIYVNKGALQQVAYSHKELLAMHPYDIKPDFNEQEFRQLLRPLLQDEQLTLNFETRHQDKYGNIIPVEIFLQYIKPLDSEPHFIAIVRDISAYKKAERALKDSEKYLQKAQQIARVGHWKLNLQTNIVWASNELLNILSFRGNNISIESFMNIVHPQDRNRVMASLESGKQGKTRDIEYRFIDPDGKVRWLHGMGGVTKDEAGKVIEVFGTIQDITDSKHIEEALKESQLMLEKAQKLSKTGHWKLVPATGEVTGSVELFHIYALPQTYSTLEAFIDIVHPEDRAMYMEVIQQAIVHGKSWDVKYRIGTCDGDEKWLHAIGDALLDEAGNVIELLGTVQDISKQKRIEDEIEKSRARFEAMFESIPDAVVFVDMDNRIKMVNAAFSKIFSYSREDVLGSRFEKLYTSLNNIKQSRSDFTLSQQSYELKYKCKGGKIFTGETVVSTLVAKDGTELGQLAIIRDISEKSHVDAVLRSLAAAGSGLKFDEFMGDILARLTALYNCEYAFVGQLQADGKTIKTLAVRANGKTEDNFEYELIHTPCEHIITREKTLVPHSASTIYAKDQMLIDMEVESYFGAPLITSDGSIIGLISVMGKSQLDIDEWTEPVLGVFATRISLELEREIASRELKRYRQHLEDLVNQRTVDLSIARDEAEAANLAKSEFLSHMSHELRTPLNAILGFAQMLELDAECLNEAQQEDIKEIIDAGQHLLTLINGVLDLAKIESGKMEVNMQRVSVRESLQQCLSLVAPQITARQISLTDDVSRKNQFVWADTTRLKQVFLNLLSNAVKYNQQAGSIVISSEIINEKYLRIHISDTGAGLTEEQISRLFMAFDRLNAPASVEGTGIGLVISRHLIELMQGSMGVDSVSGEGATFWIDLQLFEAEPDLLS